MLFTSYNFIIFLAALFVLYYIIPKKLQWILLLIASYLFYSLSGVDNLIYIAVTTVSTFLVAYKISNHLEIQSQYLKANKGVLSSEEKKAYKASMKLVRRRWLIFCLLLNFGILAVVKYSNFAIYNVNMFTDWMGSDGHLNFLDIALPLGISFYTFKSMSYIIDVSRGKHKAEKNVFKFALFVSFFPQIIQGPISRYEILSETMFSKHQYDKQQVMFGIQRILWGFFKKMVIADRILVGVNTIIQDPDNHQGIYVLLGMLFYAYELYADFTGGIDITIGIGQVLGIKMEENFDRPYGAKSITEFWRKWHITMGTWFKEYLFYPISASRPMLNLSKYSRKKFGEAIGKRLPVYISTMVVWFATGLWHGATWNFIVWGVMNGVVIIISLELKPFYEWFHNKVDVKDNRVFIGFQVARTILLMSSIRMFDLYRDVPLTFKMFGTMFTKWNISELWNGALMALGLSFSDYIVLLMGLIIITTVSKLQDRGSVRLMLSEKPYMVRYMVFSITIIAILVFGAYGEGYDASQFIYNQF